MPNNGDGQGNGLRQPAISLGPRRGYLLRAISSRLFKRSAKDFFERITFGIRDRGAVMVDDSTGELLLRYFPRRDSSSLHSLPYSELQAGGSRDDAFRKLCSAGVLTLLLLMPAAYVLFHGQLEAFVGEPRYGYWLLGIAGFILGLSVLAVLLLLVHFLRMDSEWQNAINDVLGADLRTKLFGIQHCMKSFRRFIKWRRLMTYFLIIVGLYFWLVQVLLLVLCALTELLGVHMTYWNWAFVVGVLIVQVFCFQFYSWQCWYFTDLRDPTLQLCVMLVEVDRDVVAALRPGVVATSGGTVRRSVPEPQSHHGSE